MKIPKETLEKIVEALPRGGQKTIAEKTGNSENYVSQVLNGYISVSDENVSIIYCAQAIIRDTREAEEKLKKSIDKLLN
jgi:DNA-binding transcriptional regulator YdaS (Cro superfamily)